MTFRLAIACVGLLVTAGCEKVPLTAPTESTIALTVSQASVAINGKVELVAAVTEKSGTAVHNGTVVTFTGGLGTFTPQEAVTVGGIARSTFTGVSSGTVKLGAFSGSAKATEVEIRVGSAAADFVSVRTDPATIPQNGGTVTVIASVRDSSGTALPNAQVNFTADNGQLSANSALTDNNGEARVTLVTARTTKVGASVAGKSASDFTVTALTAPTVSIGSCSSTPLVGVAVTCTVTPTVSSASGSPIQSVSINWGDGTSDRSLGSISSATTTSHTYTRADTYIVTATAVDVSGQNGRGTAAIAVTRSIPSISISASASTATVGAVLTFSVVPPTSSAPVPTTGVVVNFGDGTSRNLGAVTTSTAVTKSFSSPGAYTVSATVTDNAGTTNTATTSVIITAATPPTVTLTIANFSAGCANFTVGVTPSSGTTISSVVVSISGTSTTLYSGTAGTSFGACGLTSGQIVVAQATDSLGNTGSASVIVR